MARGLFITFEGGEGTGKSTQIERLAAKLREKGYRILETREPGGSPGAEAVRHVLLSGAAEEFGPEMEALLFAAARSDHVEQVIRPAIETGMIVLCDRFLDSSRVYQGITGNIEPRLMEAIERVAIHGMMPDLSIFLDLDAETGLHRAAARRSEGEGADRFEKETVAIHEQRRQAFLDIAAAEPERCKIIDADRTVDEVEEAVAEVVFAAFEKHFAPTAKEQA